MTIPVVIQRLVVAIALLLYFPSPSSRLLAQIPSPTPSVADTNLVSPNTGLDYAPLKKLLESQQWQAANEITRSLMLKASGRGSQGWHTAEDIQNLPCWDLKTINDLWKTASNGRFSFGVQYEIFISSGNRPGRLMAPDAYERFGDLVGWRKDNQWII
ncbi:MAG: GUN4 domain-containing protein, partial [Microcystaceae cyanobacterium]